MRIFFLLKIFLFLTPTPVSSSSHVTAGSWESQEPVDMFILNKTNQNQERALRLESNNIRFVSPFNALHV